MKLKNSTYDFLKWFALIAIPAIEGLWLTVGKVWGFPYLTEIGTTIAAIGVFLAAILGISCANYVPEESADDLIDVHPDDEEEAEG